MGKERKNDFRDSDVYKEVVRVCSLYGIENSLLVKYIKLSISEKDDCRIYFRKDRIRVNLNPNLEDKFRKVNHKWYFTIKGKYKPTPKIIDPTPFVPFDNIEAFLFELFFEKEYENSLTHIAEQIDNNISNLKLPGKTRKAIVNQRVGQGIFRDVLLKRYKKCCLCDVSNISLLRASHIKPWADSNSEEKLSVDNGFIMCPNHDLLFDRGYISFDDEGNIIISDKLSETDLNAMQVKRDMRIKLTDYNKLFLKYHRAFIFDKGENSELL